MRSMRLEDGLAEALREAVAVLREGGIVAYPTETYYALGVKFDNERALGRLHELKRRPRERTLPLIVSSPEELSVLTGRISPLARALMKRYWPGPLTLLFEAREGLSEFVTAGGKVAARMPGGKAALALAREAGFPVTATSANPSGEPPARDPEVLIRYFPRGLDLLLDGGRTPGGPPSTILDATGEEPRILREGAVIPEEVRRT